MAVNLDDPEQTKKMLADLREQMQQATARYALSARFNPNHNDRFMRTEMEKLAGATSLVRKATGELEIPVEGPPINPKERRRRDEYREYLPNGRFYRAD